MTAGHTPEMQAKIVREALAHIAGITSDGRFMTAALTLALADDATLAKLGRLLR